MAAASFIRNLDSNALAVLNRLAPQQLTELFKRDARILRAILEKTPDEQVRILSKVEKLDEVFRPYNQPYTRAGHAGRGQKR